MTKSATPSPEWSPSDKLTGLLLSGDSPVVGPNTAAELRLAIATVEPELPGRDQVDVMIGKLAMATAQAPQARLSRAVIGEMLEAYWIALRDIPLVDLRTAYVELVRTATFLPTPSEVRAVAARPGARRRYLRSRARWLLALHEREWRPPAELASPEDVQAILADLRVAGEPVGGDNG